MRIEYIILIISGVLLILGLVLFLIIKTKNKKQNQAPKPPKEQETNDGGNWLRSDKEKQEKERLEKLEKELKKLKEKDKGIDFFEEAKKTMPDPFKDSKLVRAGGALAAGAWISMFGALKRRNMRSRMTHPVSRGSTSSLSSSSGGSGVRTAASSSRGTSPVYGGGSSGGGGLSRSDISSPANRKYEAYKSLRDNSLSPTAFLQGKGAWWEAFEHIAILGAVRDTLQKLHEARETYATNETPAEKKVREQMIRQIRAEDYIAEHYGAGRERRQ